MPGKPELVSFHQNHNRWHFASLLVVLNYVFLAVQVTSCFTYPHTVLEWLVYLPRIFQVAGTMEESST